MATTAKTLLGSTQTLMTTELNALASSSTLSAGAASASPWDNTQGGGGGDGYLRGDLELVLGTPAGALAAGTACYVWFLRQVDGTNYEDGSATITPSRRPDAIIKVRAVATGQRCVEPDVRAPAGKVTVLVSQNTGQAWAASGNTLKFRPYTIQGV